MSLISDSTQKKSEISKNKIISQNNMSSHNQLGNELKKLENYKIPKSIDQKSYQNAQQKFKQMISAHLNQQSSDLGKQAKQHINDLDNLEKNKSKKTINNSSNQSFMLKEKISSRGVSPNLHYLSKGAQRPKSVLHSRHQSSENISGMSAFQTNQSNIGQVLNNCISGGSNINRKMPQKQDRNNSSIQRKLTLKNYKNERIKKQSSQNGSFEQDLKRDESLKKLQELEFQILSNRNELGNLSGLDKNNSYIQLKNQVLSAKKSSSKKDIVFSIQTDNYTQNCLKKVIPDKIQNVSCFVQENNQVNKDNKNISKNEIVTYQKQEVLNSKENINMNKKNQSMLISEQNKEKNKNDKVNQNIDQNIKKKKSISLYQQINSQSILGFNSFSNNKSQINNIPQENNQNIQQVNIYQQQSIQNKNPSEMINQLSQREKQNQIAKYQQQKLKSKSFIEQQITNEKQESPVQKQKQLQITPMIQQLHSFANNSSKNININSNRNIQIQPQSSQNQISNIPPIFIGANVSKSLQNQSSVKKNLSNQSYYYNDKYLSDSQSKKQFNQKDRSTSIISNGNDAQNGICNSQLNYKAVTPEPAQKNKNKFNSQNDYYNKISDQSFRQQVNNEKQYFEAKTSVRENNNLNIHYTNNSINSSSKFQEKLLYNPSSSNSRLQKCDFSKRKNSNSLLRKSINNQQDLQIQQETSISRQNSKSLYIPKSKTDCQKSIEINQNLDNKDKQTLFNENKHDSDENNSQSQREQSNKENMSSQQNQLSKNSQSSLSELRLRRIRQCNASNSRNSIKLPNMSLQQNHSQQQIEPNNDQDQTQTKQIKQSQKSSMSLNRIIDDKSGLLKEQTKKRIQQLIEQQNKNKKLNQIIQAKAISINNSEGLQQSKGEMKADELIDVNCEQTEKTNIDPEEEIKGYIKGV